jgi:hypothetical protein
VNRVDAPILGVVAAFHEPPSLEIVEKRNQPAWHHAEKRSVGLLGDVSVGSDRAERS